MPIYNFTMDDSSPMITYSSGWVDTDLSDPEVSGYLKNTSHATNIQGATATVTFFGNAVYLYGGIRPNYGSFNITLDGITTSHGVPSPANTESQKVRFASTGLSSNTHTLTVTNAGNGTFVDVDFFTFTTGDSGSSVSPTYSYIDDSSPLISYHPSLQWLANVSLGSPFFNSTLHTSSLPGAQATVPFDGNDVAVYGNTDPSHGNFTAKIDNLPAVSLNGFAPALRPQTLLYWASGLPSGKHTITITNQNGSHIDLDFVGVTLWGSTSIPTDKLTPSATAMVLGVSLGVSVLIACAVTLFLNLRARRMRRRQGNFEEAKDQCSPREASREPRKVSFVNEANALPASSAGPPHIVRSDTGPSIYAPGIVSAMSHPHKYSSPSPYISPISASGSQSSPDQGRTEGMSFGRLLLTTPISPRKKRVPSQFHLDNTQLGDGAPPKYTLRYTETTRPLPPTPIQPL